MHDITKLILQSSPMYHIDAIMLLSFVSLVEIAGCHSTWKFWELSILYAYNYFTVHLSKDLHSPTVYGSQPAGKQSEECNCIVVTFLQGPLVNNRETIMQKFTARQVLE